MRSIRSRTTFNYTPAKSSQRFNTAPSLSVPKAAATTRQHFTKAFDKLPFRTINTKRAKMSTHHHNHPAACCNIPPIVIEGYEAKGNYETINGLKTYVTGPSDATTAILFISDIFGYFPQTLQGADILATADEDHKYLVLIPDWFDGKPAHITWFPPDNEEKQKLMGEFFSDIGSPARTIARVPGFVAEATKQKPNIKTWGVIGFCWGGKVVSLTSTKDTPFSVAAECHPAFIAPDDGKSITIPIVVLASKDENQEDLKGFEANLTTEHYVETFGDQIHGWMAARSDLKDDKVRKEYERGYRTVLEFFAKHL